MAQPHILMYTTGVCPYCIQAKHLLKARGVADIEELRVDQNPAIMQQMLDKTQRRTVPQIYIGDAHVGGFEDLAALDRAGKLTEMLT